MSCVNCGTGLCGCGVMYNAQQNAAARYATMNANIQGGVNGVTGVNYQMMQQAQLMGPWNQTPIDMQDYFMFKKYAHLTEQEVVDVYLAERVQIEEAANNVIQAIEEKTKIQLDTQEKEFWTWMSTYRRSLTKERLEKYFLALL